MDQQNLGASFAKDVMASSMDEEELLAEHFLQLDISHMTWSSV